MVSYCDCFGARRPTNRQRLVRRKRHIGHHNVPPKSGIPQRPGNSFEFAPALPNNAFGKLLQNLRRVPTRDNRRCLSQQASSLQRPGRKTYPQDEEPSPCENKTLASCPEPVGRAECPYGVPMKASSQDASARQRLQRLPGHLHLSPRHPPRLAPVRRQPPSRPHTCRKRSRRQFSHELLLVLSDEVQGL